MSINNFFLILLLFENILHCTSQTQEVTGINKSEQTKGFQTNTNGVQGITNNEAVGKTENRVTNNLVGAQSNQENGETGGIAMTNTLKLDHNYPENSNNAQNNTDDEASGNVTGPAFSVTTAEVVNGSKENSIDKNANETATEAAVQTTKNITEEIDVNSTENTLEINGNITKSSNQNASTSNVEETMNITKHTGTYITQTEANIIANITERNNENQTEITGSITDDITEESQTTIKANLSDNTLSSIKFSEQTETNTLNTKSSGFPSSLPSVSNLVHLTTATDDCTEFIDSKINGTTNEQYPSTDNTFETSSSILSSPQTSGIPSDYSSVSVVQSTTQVGTLNIGNGTSSTLFENEADLKDCITNTTMSTNIQEHYVESSNGTILSTISPDTSSSIVSSVTSSGEITETNLKLESISEETIPYTTIIYSTQSALTTETILINSHDEEETGKYQEETTTEYVDQESSTPKEWRTTHDESTAIAYKEQTASIYGEVDIVDNEFVEPSEGRVITTPHPYIQHLQITTTKEDVAKDDNFFTRDNRHTDETSSTLLPTSTTKHIQEEEFENGQINPQDMNEENQNPEKIVFFPLSRETETAENILIKTINFVRAELVTHIFSDREMNEAIRALHQPDIFDMFQTLKQHPKYETLDQLLIEHQLGSLNYFDLSNLVEYLPKRGRIQPNFKTVYNHIEQYLLRKETLNRLIKAFAESEFYTVLHKPTLKHKIQTLIRDILHLRITHRILNTLKRYNFDMKTAIALVLNIIGYT